VTVQQDEPNGEADQAGDGRSASEALATQFEGHRARLRGVAYRLLGSPDEADDAVQEAWLRLSRSDEAGIENLAGWLTTVVSRVCLDMLRSRRSRREDPLDLSEATAGGHGTSRPEPGHPSPRNPEPSNPEPGNPEDAAMLADSVGVALLVVLDAMAPAERLAFVLHDVFAVPFEEIASTLGRSPAATRQLASRGRRRVQGPRTSPDADQVLQRQVVEAFLAASRDGDFAGLVALLDPDAVVLADPVAVEFGATSRVRGAAAVAETFSGRARTATLALVDGLAGAVWAPGGKPRVVFGFTVEAGRIVEIELLADPDLLSRLDLALLDT
jgi:RNA polymerase sigma factor (sigma-70 family)